jgi:hypothetical protein
MMLYPLPLQKLRAFCREFEQGCHADAIQDLFESHLPS